MNTPSRNQLQFNGCFWGRLWWDQGHSSIFIFQGQELRDRQELLLINDNGEVPTPECMEALWIWAGYSPSPLSVLSSGSNTFCSLPDFWTRDPTGLHWPGQVPPVLGVLQTLPSHRSRN